MAVSPYSFPSSQDKAQKKRPVDTLIFELIGVVALVYAAFFIFFELDLKKAIRYFETGQYEQAIDKFTAIAGITATDPAIYYRLALSHARLGKHDLAIPYYLQLLTIKKPTSPFIFSSKLPAPSLVEIYDGLIFSYFELGQYDQVIIFSQQLLLMNPRDAQAYKNLSLAYIKKASLSHSQAEFDKALEFIEKSAELSPSGMTEDDKKMRDYLKNQ